jgi:hypothetical protein
LILLPVTFLLVLEEGANGKSRRRRKLGLDAFNLVRHECQKRPLGNQQRASWNSAGDEKFAADSASVDIEIQTIETCQIFKAVCWNELTNFLIYFADYTFQESFLALAVAAEETYLAWMYDTRNVIALLQ